VAAHYGFIEIVKTLLNYKAQVNTIRSRDGTTALHSAAINNHLKIVRILIQAEADINHRHHLVNNDSHDEKGGRGGGEEAGLARWSSSSSSLSSPLMIAIRHDADLEIVKLMVEAKAEVTNRKDLEILVH